MRIAQLTETLAKLMTTLGEKTEAAAAAKIAAEKTKAAAETAIAETAALEDELTELFSELQTDAERFATEQALLGLSLDDDSDSGSSAPDLDTQKAAAEEDEALVAAKRRAQQAEWLHIETGKDDERPAWPCLCPRDHPRHCARRVPRPCGAGGRRARPSSGDAVGG